MASLDDLVDIAFSTHRRDAGQLRKFDDYARGEQASPYGARGHTDEFRALAKRAVTNWIGLAVDIPCQMSIIEGYRVRGAADPPEWEAFKGNRLDRKQYSFHHAAGVFGHSFAEVEWPKRGETASGAPLPYVRGLPTSRTVALYDDPFGDRFPVFALKFDAAVSGDSSDGEATAWTQDEKLRISWRKSGDDGRDVTVVSREKHGFPVVPIVRWVVQQDLEGRTTGLVEPLIQPQNSVNQAKYDLSVTRNFSAYKVRTASGLEGEPVLDNDGQHVLDEATGEPLYEAPEIGPEKFIVSEDEKTKFGTLDETPLDGFIESSNQEIEQFAAVSQIPPHALQGRMANLSAEALVAAEEGLMRLVGSLQRSWGDTWATLFQLISYAQGQSDALDDHTGHVRWRDMRARAMGETVDALGKGAQMLGIPAEGLWKMFPGADAATLQDWKTLVDAAPPVEVTPEGNAMNLSRNLAGMASASARRVPGSARGTAAPQRRTVA